jgi:DNA replication and repair protein RecF
VHLARLRLRNFRNFTRLEAGFAPGFHLFLGENAQGKTNLLEAIYLLATLRSFRGAGNPQMVQHGEKGYFIGGKVLGQGEHELKIYWSAQERRVSLDGAPVKRISQALGVLRAVVFCSEDLQLVKGPANRRRRFMDLLLAQTNPNYLPVLQRYALALRSRNALLKGGTVDPVALDGFTQELAGLGEQLIRWRRLLIPQILPLARTAYGRIARDREELRLEYMPSVKRDFAVELAQTRSREQIHRATLVGPHRDDLEFLLNDRRASQYASEGQRRSLVIALKMTQAEFLTATHGVPPVLLIDDVMGELDLGRRSGFLPLLQRARHGRSQVFMTATEANWPAELNLELKQWRVESGTLREE